jgi:hypothetical protein
MASRSVTIPLIGAIAFTRALLGAGVGLLMSSRFNERQRRKIGRTLLGIGVATTVPLMVRVLRSRHRPSLMTRMMA